MAKKSKGNSGGHVYRSAETGKFVTKKYAEKHPKTTVRETKKDGRDGGPKRR